MDQGFRRRRIGCSDPVTWRSVSGYRLQHRTRADEVDVTGEICTRWNEKDSTWRKSESCPIQRYKPEQIVTMSRQIEVSIANGKSTPQAWGRHQAFTQL
jgi:hypothetical protein